MRKMKRFISLAMVLVLALSMAPAAHAAEYEYAVNGGNLYFDPTTGTITNCDSSVYSADIPEEIYGIPVVEIGKDAFAECRKLVSVTIPSSVTTIGDRAFSSCESLKSIVIPDSVTKLGGSTVQSVFAYCISLESATIPGSIRKLDGYLFADCERLSSITLGEGIEVIKRGFVIRCDSLEEIVLPDSVGYFW